MVQIEPLSKTCLLSTNVSRELLIVPYNKPRQYYAKSNHVNTMQSETREYLSKLIKVLLAEKIMQQFCRED